MEHIIEQETRTKRTRTEASLHLSNNMAQCPVWDSPRHRGLDCKHTEQQQAAAALASTQSMAEQDTTMGDHSFYCKLVQLIEQHDIVQAMLTTMTGETITLDVEASDDAEAGKTITPDVEASSTIDPDIHFKIE